MPKRRRTSPGTKDVYYQNFFFTLGTTPAQENMATRAIVLPAIPTQYVGTHTSIVRELLKVRWEGVPDVPAAAEVHHYSWGLCLGEPSATVHTYIHNPNTVCRHTYNIIHDVHTSGAYWTEYDKWPLVWDFQDAMGHGKLIARDTLWLWARHSNNQARNIDFTIMGRCEYRLTQIPLQEYIGILGEQSYLGQ